MQFQVMMKWDQLEDTVPSLMGTSPPAEAINKLAWLDLCTVMARSSTKSDYRAMARESISFMQPFLLLSLMQDMEFTN